MRRTESKKRRLKTKTIKRSTSKRVRKTREGPMEDKTEKNKRICGKNRKHEKRKSSAKRHVREKASGI